MTIKNNDGIKGETKERLLRYNEEERVRLRKVI